jgi:hypothetical protein
MHTNLWTISIGLGLFFAMLLCLDLGFRAARWTHANPDDISEGVGTIEAAVFALLGLLLGFSFSGGTERLETRRALIVQEANAIGTAYLRLDLLQPDDQGPLRDLFRQYLDARIGAYAKLPDTTAADREFTRATEIQKQIWIRGVRASESAPNTVAERLVLPALNDMIDVTTSRTIALFTNLPGLIFGLVIGVSLLSGVLAGWAMAKRRQRSWIHMVLYAGTVAITVYTVADLDSPRSGLIRLDRADRAMTELRDSIR